MGHSDASFFCGVLELFVTADLIHFVPAVFLQLLDTSLLFIGGATPGYVDYAYGSISATHCIHTRKKGLLHAKSKKPRAKKERS